MQAWEDVVRSALLGTERQPPAVPQMGGAIGQALAGIGTADKEHALLSAAAVLSTCRRAGGTPPRAGDDAAKADAEAQPACSARAAEFLGRILTGEYRAVLPEWLAGCVAAGKRVPYRYLPELLEIGKAAPIEHRELIAAVIGRRGRWLMQQNPAWQFDAVGADDEETWQTGAKASRAAALRRIRARDPAKARELLQSTWEQESPEDRAAFVTTFAVKLGPDDEPFLEQCLDDRRKEVRKAAVDLLARLPDSPLARRMFERLQPVLKISVKGKLLGGKKVAVDVEPPADCDKEMARDGVDAKPPGAVGKGLKTQWVMQMLSVVPPRKWAEASGAKPADLVAAAVKSDWRGTLLEGWAYAAERQRDRAWAMAILDHYLSVDVEKGLPNDTGVLAALARAVPDEQLEELLTDAIRTSDLRLHRQAGVSVLREHDRVWGPKLSRTFLERFRKDLGAMQQGGNYQVWMWVQQDLGRVLHPSVATEFGTWDQAKSWGDAIAKAQSLLQFRHDMLKEIGS